MAEVECPCAKYGCEAEPMKRRDLLSHKKEFIIEHMDMVETKNQELEVKVTRLESELNTMKRLDGVKWKLCDVDKLSHGQTLESSCFYVNKYELKCICTFGSNWLGSCFDFSVQRVAGEFDGSLGVAYITECRIILQNCNGAQSCHSGEINYQLKVGNISDVFYHLPNWEYSSFLSPDKSLTILLCFDVNNSPNTLSSEIKDPFLCDEAPSLQDPDPFYIPDL